MIGRLVRALVCATLMLAGAAYANAPATPHAVSMLGKTTIVLNGDLDPANAARFAALLSSPAGRAVDAFVIRSRRGDLASALDIAGLVHRRGLTVRVDEVCAALCADYVIPAAPHVIAPSGALIVLTPGGSAQSLMISAVGHALDAASIKSVQDIVARESRFFASVGTPANPIETTETLIVQMQDALKTQGLPSIAAIVPDRDYISTCLGVRGMEVPDYGPEDSARFQNTLGKPIAFLIGRAAWLGDRKIAPLNYACGRTPLPVAANPADAKDMQVTVKFFPKEQRQVGWFEIVNGAMLIRVQIEGRDTWALIDTGAITAIDSNFAQSAGILLGSGLLPLSTPSGKIERRKAEAFSLIVPGQFRLQGVASAIDLSSVSRTVQRPIGMILGRDYLSHLALVVSAEHSNFVFLPGGNINMSSPAIPFAIEGDQALLRVMIDGRPVELAIDSGSSTPVTLSPAAWDRVKVDGLALTDGVHIHADGVLVHTRSATAPEMAIGPITSHDTPVSIEAVVAEDRDGTIGLPLLMKFDFALDLLAHKLWLAPRGALTIK